MRVGEAPQEELYAAVAREVLFTRCNARLEELLDPNCPDEGKEGEHQARQDGDERHDHVDRSGASAMDALERRCAAVNELAWDVERLVHRHLPLLQYLRTREPSAGLAEKRRAPRTVPSLTLQGGALCTPPAPNATARANLRTVAGVHHAVFETGGGCRKALWK